MEQRWVLLVYKIPHEPSALRVAAWRKLKKLGALLLHDAIWVLPATPPLQEQFQWLAAEIRESGGEALVWDAHLLLNEQAATLQAQFLAQAEAGYHEILTALTQTDSERGTLARRFQQVQAIDYFHAPLGEQVRIRLAEGGTR